MRIIKVRPFGYMVLCESRLFSCNKPASYVSSGLPSHYSKYFSRIETSGVYILLLIAVASATFFLFVGNAFSVESGFPDNNIRVIKVKAVADEEFRRSADWVEEIEGSIKRSSAFYEEQFGIKYELVQIGEWVSDNNIKDVRTLLSQLKNEVERDGSDIVVGFTGQARNVYKCVFSRTALGIALPFSSYVIVRADRSTGFDYHTMSLVLTHELGHLFGAMHVDGSSSVMSTSINNNTSFRFDDNNSELIKLTKFVDFDKGLLSLSNESLDQLIDKYKDSLEYGFENAPRRLLIGSMYYKRGLVGDAIGQYEAAIKLDRKDPEPLTHLGIAYAENGLLDKAIAVLSKAVRLGSNDGSAHVNLGMALVRKGMLDEAIDQVEKAMKINNDNPEMHCILGGIYIRKGLFDEAIYECRQALRIRSTYASAYYNMGIAYQSKLMYDSAVNAYKEAIGIEYNNLMARNNLGMAYYEQGFMGKAESEYLKLLQIDPANEMAINNLEAVLLAKREVLICDIE